MTAPTKTPSTRSRNHKFERPGIWSLEAAMAVGLVLASIPLVNIVALPLIFFIVGFGFLTVFFASGIRKRLHALSRRTVDNPSHDVSAVWMKGLPFPPEGKSRRWQETERSRQREPRSHSKPQRQVPRPMETQ